MFCPLKSLRRVVPKFVAHCFPAHSIAAQCALKTRLNRFQFIIRSYIIITNPGNPGTSNNFNKFNKFNNPDIPDHPDTLIGPIGQINSIDFLQLMPRDSPVPGLLRII